MTKSIYYSIGFLFVFSLASCTSTQKDDFAAIDSEILEIHDEVMPKLEDVHYYSENLRNKLVQLDSLEQEGVSSNTLAEQRLKANDILTKLQVADSLMWAWMRGYEADSAKALPDEADTRRYFEEEKRKIIEVKERTESSLSEAKSFLDSE